MSETVETVRNAVSHEHAGPSVIEMLYAERNFFIGVADKMEIGDRAEQLTPFGGGSVDDVIDRYRALEEAIGYFTPKNPTDWAIFTRVGFEVATREHRFDAEIAQYLETISASHAVPVTSARPSVDTSRNEAAPTLISLLATALADESSLGKKPITGGISSVHVLETAIASARCVTDDDSAVVLLLLRKASQREVPALSRAASIMRLASQSLSEFQGRADAAHSLGVLAAYMELDCTIQEARLSRAKLLHSLERHRREARNSIIAYSTDRALEFYFEDAALIAETLGLPLEAREFKGLEPVPVCRVMPGQLDPLSHRIKGRIVFVRDSQSIRIAA